MAAAALGLYGSLTFSNGGTGAFAGLTVLRAAGATLSIQSGATVTGTALTIGDTFGDNGTVTIDGTGSAFTLSGAAASAIGAASSGTGTLNVNNSGVFNSGTGTQTVNATGTVAIGGGTFNANGSVVVNGQLTRSDTGVLSLAAGKTLTMQNGGDAILTGTFTLPSTSNLAVTEQARLFPPPARSRSAEAARRMCLLAAHFP